ncbi:MAG: hypothetical protein AAF316_03275 [Cyanobacteria bacterium P01_A01_bin.80]
MPLKSYSIKYRKLKQAYEKEVGKKVSDATWGRVVSTLKQIFGFKIESENAEKLVILIGDLKKRFGTFSGRSENFDERWKAFKHFYDMDKEFSGRGFLNTLTNYLQIELKDVPRSTKYYWFNKACISYQTDQMYKSKDLALVAFIACKWAINKRPVAMKSANPEAYKLTIGRSKNNG